MKKIITALFAITVTFNCLAININEILSNPSNNHVSYYERTSYSNRYSLQDELDMAEDEIYELKEEIKELKYELDDKNDEVYSLHSWNVSLWIAVSILLIIIVVLIIYIYRHKLFFQAHPRFITP